MADDSPNSMQAQLGLVSQGGSFNPLGIATPAPPPPPMVRHPGDVSADIVRQTQTAMATTLQTTSAMRMGGMGGMAYGGGNGLGAVGAFAQQYTQNMGSIGSQHINPFSAQMMGMMGGMGGFSPGALPNPAMMTTPGMGIYRPFSPMASPTVSPFPQMPIFPTPFTPMPPPAMFQTPMELSHNISVQAGQRRTAAMFAMPGVAARAGTDMGFGFAGAGLGASLGARFGPMGALIGGGIGAAAGVFGSEHFGFGGTAQHTADGLNPFRTLALRGQQMLGASQNFVSGGPDLNPMTGRGLSSQGSTHLARLLEDTAFSSRFRRDTGTNMSAQDLTRITNVAGQQGMLNDTQSVEQIHDRVKTIAKSLVSFMKIANEPNVVEALKSMGRMRQMGLSVSETMDAALDARMFARMAGTSHKGIMEMGGMPGAMLFQQQGLSAGLGMRVGMGAIGMANAAVTGGAFSPQRLAMLGGVQGVAQHEMESSAAFLRMPMMAAAMSTMGRGGEFGVNGGAIAALRGGHVNIGQMAGTGATNILNAVRQQGVGAIGLMQVQETELQDRMGRLLGPQGLQSAKMGQVMQTMGMMGLDKNPGGFATAALSMGFTNDQVKTMMSQASGPGYFRNVQAQNQIQQMDVRGLAQSERDRNRPNLFSNFTRNGSGDVSRVLGDSYAGLRNFGESVTNFFATDEQERQARKHGQTVLRTDRSLLATSDEEMREMFAMSGSDASAATGRTNELRGRGDNAPSDRNRRRGFSRFNLGSTNDLDRIMGGDFDTRLERARRRGGFSAAFGAAGVHAEGALNVLGAVGTGLLQPGLEALGFKARDLQEEGEADDRQQERANSAFKEAQNYEDRGAFSKQLGNLGKKTGLGAEGVAGMVAKINRGLVTSARQDRNLLLTNKQFGAEQYDRANQLTGGEFGKLSSDQQQSVLALSAVGVGAESGNQEATAARGNVGSKTQLERVDRAKQDIVQLSNVLFGQENKGFDLFGGTQKRRNDLMDKIYGKGRTGKGALLLALKARAESDPEAAAAFDDAYKKLATTDPRALREYDQLIKEGVLDDYKSELSMMGLRLTKGAGNTADRIGTVEQIKKNRTNIKRGEARAQGLARAFGKQTSAEAPIDELLQGNLEDIDDPHMQEIGRAHV